MWEKISIEEVGCEGLPNKRLLSRHAPFLVDPSSLLVPVGNRRHRTSDLHYNEYSIFSLFLFSSFSVDY